MAEVRWPRLDACAGCGAEVLLGVHEHRRERVTMEPWPVLIGVGRCSYCQGKGRRLMPIYTTCGPRPKITMPGDLEGQWSKGDVTSCPECAGTGLRGEELTKHHVVMAYDGIVRAHPVLLMPWDSAYRRHKCPARAPVAPKANGHQRASRHIPA